MADPRTKSDHELSWAVPRAPPAREVPHLVIAWSLEEPGRVGEAACIEGRCVLGRGEPLPEDPAPRVVFQRHRPHETTAMPPLESTRISRLQLELWPASDGSLEVRSLGRCPLILRGQVVQGGVVQPGETVTLTNTMVLVATTRWTRWKGTQAYPAALDFPFGAADSHGMVGESPAIWALRERLAIAATTLHHVLLLGESGVGKELAARALHGMWGLHYGGTQAHRAPFVARNAATFPEGLVDAELFGTAKNYPNAGSPERRGVIGEADGGTLFLDEIGELPHHLQAHLLRVLDHQGEYQRLGEARTLRSRFRLVAATNRPVEALKHDLAARFSFRIAVPGLDQRREDVPLLLQHMLAQAAHEHPALAARFFEQRNGATAEARVDPRVIEALLRRRFTLHSRELERLMWVALSTSPGEFLSMTPELLAELGLQEDATERGAEARAGAGHDHAGWQRARDPDGIAREEIEAALAATGGNVTEAAQRLGVKNRFVLRRLIKKYGIAAPDGDPVP